MRNVMTSIHLDPLYFVHEKNPLVKLDQRICQKIDERLEDAGKSKGFLEISQE